MFLGGCSVGSGASWLCSVLSHGVVVPGLQGGWVGVRVVVEGALPALDSAGASLLHVKASGPANEEPWTQS